MTDERRIEPPFDVTPAVFAQWRTARRGAGHGEVMNNPLWQWLVQSGHGPYPVNQHFDGPPSSDAGPGWTADRFGQTSTTLPDGRMVQIGGEHEDWYDPDFFIYNDVIIRHPDGSIDILGYPEDVFPPTDFHTATLVGNDIVVIGSVGYVEHRRPDATPVVVLDTKTWMISAPPVTGDNPGWISRHRAHHDPQHNTITVSGGEAYHAGERPLLVENVDEWALHLDRWTWERLTDRRWQRWQITRTDGGPSELWRLRTELLAEGAAPSGDLAALYEPPLDHRTLPSAGPEEFNIFRIVLGDVTVRFVESMAGVMVTVEGELPDRQIETVIDHLRDRLAALESAAYSAIRRA